MVIVMLSALQLEFGNDSSLREGGRNVCTQRKTAWGKDENQQQTPPTLKVYSRVQHWGITTQNM